MDGLYSENPIKMGDLGGSGTTIFGNPHVATLFSPERHLSTGKIVLKPVCSGDILSKLHVFWLKKRFQHSEYTPEDSHETCPHGGLEDG